MLSVWGLFHSKSQNFVEMTKQHLDVPSAHVYDATNPKARDFYWNNLAGKLFSLGLGRVLARQRRARDVALHG